MPNRNGITNNQYPITNNQLGAKTNCDSIRHLLFGISHWSFKKRPAFTLIELLIVISIIAVLTLLATYSYNNAQARARDSKRKQDTNNIKKALQLYFDDKDSYPSTITSANDSLGPYISPIPVDPRLGTGYIYSSTPTTYTLTACLENPNDPTKDAVKNSSCSTPANFTITNPN